MTTSATPTKADLIMKLRRAERYHIAQRERHKLDRRFGYHDRLVHAAQKALRDLGCLTEAGASLWTDRLD